MQKYVVRNIPRPEPEILESYRDLDTSTVYEAQGKLGLMHPYMRPLIQGSRICGPAVTVICPAGDNLMIHAAIEVCRPGDVLVVTTIGESNHGMVGELIVRALMKRGVQGLVIDSGIRDAAVIRSLGFPVWSKAIHSMGTTKNRGGWVNAPAVCAGAQVAPGDLVIADDDGVVVVRREDLNSSLEAARKRVEKEAVTKTRIENGELSLDFYGLRETLKSEQVMYYDHLSDVKTE
jgi:4-hydroxy-4-methyl-2-oxoglutarate aldolase